MDKGFCSHLAASAVPMAPAPQAALDAAPGRASGKRGMTLAELILAFGLLVPIIVVVVGLFPYSHVVARRASDVQTGFDVACSQVERLRAGDFDALVSSTSTVQGAHGVVYMVEVSVQPAVPAQKTVTLKKVSVVVRWVTRQSEQVQLDTIVARTAP